MSFRVCKTSLSPGQARAALHGENTAPGTAFHPPQVQCNVCFDVRLLCGLTFLLSST